MIVVDKELFTNFVLEGKTVKELQEHILMGMK